MAKSMGLFYPCGRVSGLNSVRSEPQIAMDPHFSVVRVFSTGLCRNSGQANVGNG